MEKLGVVQEMNVEDGMIKVSHQSRKACCRLELEKLAKDKGGQTFCSCGNQLISECL